MYNSIQHFLDFGIENIRETVKNFIEQGDDVANLVLGLQKDIFELGRNIVIEVLEGMDEHIRESGYFRAIAAKDDKAILKTLTPKHNHPNVVLFGDETRTLLSVDYNADDPMRKSYITHGGGSVNGTKKENVIVFKVSFNVKYPKGVSGSFNEGDYKSWGIILIRDDKTSPWLIDDQGV